uniref:Tetraspanin n=1 Tax=Maylandia zebra TaxID=106582 RepID=A0A3P9BVZ1_9CICH
MMSGKHFKAHEVSCCIKYFIFGFNIIFWVSPPSATSALRENSFLLKFFSVFLGIIFFLELTAGVLAFVFKDWIKDQLNFFINNNIRAYRDDIDLQNLIDFTQEYWECCGAFGADDWNLNIYFNCTDSNPSREKCGVPFSCCTKDPAVGFPPNPGLISGYKVQRQQFPITKRNKFLFCSNFLVNFEKKAFNRVQNWLIGWKFKGVHIMPYLQESKEVFLW